MAIAPDAQIDRGAGLVNHVNRRARGDLTDQGHRGLRPLGGRRHRRPAPHRRRKNQFIVIAAGGQIGKRHQPAVDRRPATRLQRQTIQKDTRAHLAGRTEMA